VVGKRRKLVFTAGALAVTCVCCGKYSVDTAPSATGGANASAGGTASSGGGATNGGAPTTEVAGATMSAAGAVSSSAGAPDVDAGTADICANVHCASNQQCLGGLCVACVSDQSCGPQCTPCTGGTPKCKSTAGVSECVRCLSDADCGGAAQCSPMTNTCIPPSCVDLPATCGPKGNANCCASPVVTGVATASFYRNYYGQFILDTRFPARVSDFSLDTYEVTVGRFQKFWAAYPGSMPVNGSGKNPNDAADTGWNAAWNAYLPVDQAALKVDLYCAQANNPGAIVSPTLGSDDNLPINCLNWLEAEAFCIWDGGRLPTDAEWNYAAVGGTEQRYFPWGDEAPDANNQVTVTPPLAVGSRSPAGDGKWGQADLLGNVQEFVQDEATTMKTPCDNCANLITDLEPPNGNFNGTVVRVRGIADTSGTFPYSTSSSGIHLAFGNSDLVGVRCARLPQQ
jgi:sulfatase modifying factor 1